MSAKIISTARIAYLWRIDLSQRAQIVFYRLQVQLCFPHRDDFHWLAMVRHSWFGLLDACSEKVFDSLKY